MWYGVQPLQFVMQLVVLLLEGVELGGGGGRHAVGQGVRFVLKPVKVRQAGPDLLDQCPVGGELGLLLEHRDVGGRMAFDGADVRFVPA